MMAFAPLAKGLLTGKFGAETTFEQDDGRSRNPAFQGEAFRQRLDAVEKLRPVAARCGKTLAQLAINSDLYQQGVTTALTGAKRPTQVPDNAAGAGWRTSVEDLDAIEGLVGDLADLE